MIPFLDLKQINASYRQEFKSSFKELLDKGQYILSEQVETFEDNFANYCGTKYCIGTGNGLDALFLIFKAYLDLGILKKGDEILVPANTFIASFLAIINNGLKPIFVEPDPETFNISFEDLKSKTSLKTKAILVVHLYGQLAEMEKIIDFGKNNNLLIIEDAAQAHGATCQIPISNFQNTKAGGIGDAAAFSFYPAKNLGALGDGGAVTTNNADLAHQIKLIRNYGSTKKYHYKTIGYNSRLDEIQACFLNIKLKYLDRDNEIRRQIAKKYLNGIHNDRIKLPYYDGSENHVFYTFVIRVENREEFISYLKEQNIGWLIYYPIPAHQQEALTAYKNLKLPVTEALSKSIISIPIHQVLKDNDIDYIIETLNNY